MNELTTKQDFNPVVINSASDAAKAFSVANLIFHPFAMERLDQFAEKMARSRGLLPDSISGDVEMCKALIIEAGSRNMSPYAIGRHAFKQPNGSLGFESKVYKAMAKAMGINFDYEKIGDWTKVIGKFEVKSAVPPKKGKYNVATYTARDEQGLAVRVIATYSDGRKKEMDVYMSQCHPRMSVNWANDPYTQTIYAATKKFLRIEDPEVIMGIFDEDDNYRDGEVFEREINPAPQSSENLDIDDVFSEPTIEHQQGQDGNLDIDDVFSESPLSKADELSGYIHDCHDIESVKEVEGYILEAKENGELSDHELSALKNECQMKRNSFK